MSINNQIRRLRESNYQTLPTNRERFENPYMWESVEEAVNEWRYIDKPPILPPDEPEEDLDPPFNPVGVEPMGSDVSDDDLARILQGDAYTASDRRLKLTGYHYLRDLSNDQTSVYIGPNRILVGFRGTADESDFKADAYLAKKAIGDFVDKYFGTEKYEDEGKGFLPRWGYTEYKERTLANDKLVKQLRRTYPNKRILLAGHSWGGSQVKQVLADNPGDMMLSGHSFNSWLDPKFKEDVREVNKNTIGDVISTLSNIFQKPKGTVTDIDTKASLNAVRDITALGAQSLGQGKVRELFNNRLKQGRDLLMRNIKETGEAELLENYGDAMAVYNLDNKTNPGLVDDEAIDWTEDHISNMLGPDYTEAELEAYMNSYRDEAGLLDYVIWSNNRDIRGLPLRGLSAYLDYGIPALNFVGGMTFGKDVFNLLHTSENFRPSRSARKYLLPDQYKEEKKRSKRRVKQQRRFREYEDPI